MPCVAALSLKYDAHMISTCVKRKPHEQVSKVIMMNSNHFILTIQLFNHAIITIQLFNHAIITILLFHHAIITILLFNHSIIQKEL